MIIGLSSQTSDRRQDRSQRTATVEGIMPVSHCANYTRLSVLAFVLLFSVSTVSSFIAGRVFSCSVTLTESYNKSASASIPSLQVPAAQTASPNPDRATHFAEIGGGGHLLGPSASSLTTSQQSPSRTLDSRQPYTANVGAEEKSGDGGQAWKSYVVYVEHLVHSALFTHNNPVRVAILGDESGMIATEVLKHSTVSDLEVFVLSGKAASLEDATFHQVDDPRVKRIQTDPERLPSALVQRSHSGGEYDVILWNRGMYVTTVLTCE